MSRTRPTEHHLPIALVQITATRNPKGSPGSPDEPVSLFGLTAGGEVYEYDFTAGEWWPLTMRTPR